MDPNVPSEPTRVVFERFIANMKRDRELRRLRVAIFFLVYFGVWALYAWFIEVTTNGS